MPLSVEDVDSLQEYIQGVMERAGHHANGVENIALALVGAVLWRKDENTAIKVMQQSGAAKNVLWVHIAGSRYAFSYKHDAAAIELRRGGVQGEVLHSFTNKTSLKTLKDIFAGL